MPVKEVGRVSDHAGDAQAGASAREAAGAYNKMFEECYPSGWHQLGVYARDIAGGAAAGAFTGARFGGLYGSIAGGAIGGALGAEAALKALDTEFGQCLHDKLKQGK